MPLLRNGTVDPTVWNLHTAGAAPAANTLVALNDYLENAAAWQAVSGPWMAVVQPADDTSELPAELLAQPQLGIAFPAYTDGRGYSHARQLRRILGYTGELVATGDVRRDQIDFMAQVGFDAFECATDINVADWQKALTELHVTEAS